MFTPCLGLDKGRELHSERGCGGCGLPVESGMETFCFLKLPCASRKWPGEKTSGFSKWHGSGCHKVAGLRMGYTVVP